MSVQSSDVSLYRGTWWYSPNCPATQRARSSRAVCHCPPRKSEEHPLRQAWGGTLTGQVGVLSGTECVLVSLSPGEPRSEEHTSELQSRFVLVGRHPLEETKQ